MMNRFKVCLGIMVFLASCAAFAGNRAGAFTLNLNYGYLFFSSQRHMDDAFIPNVSLGYNFTKHWGIEALFGMIHTHFHTPGLKHISGNLYAIDGLYHFSQYHLIEPFVLAGIGVIALRPASGSQANNQSNVNVGAGAQIFFNPSIALRADVRDFYTTTGGGKNDVLVNMGLSFLWG